MHVVPAVVAGTSEVEEEKCRRFVDQYVLLRKLSNLLFATVASGRE